MSNYCCSRHVTSGKPLVQMCVFEEGFEVNAAAMTTAVAAAAAAHFDIVQKCEACLQSG